MRSTLLECKRRMSDEDIGGKLETVLNDGKPARCGEDRMSVSVRCPIQIQTIVACNEIRWERQGVGGGDI